MEACAAEIRELVRRMEEDGAVEEGVSGEMERVVIACKDFCVGNVVWSLSTERYGMGGMRRVDGGGIELII